MKQVLGQKSKVILSFICSILIAFLMTSCKNESYPYNAADKNCALQFKWSLENDTIEIVSFDRYDYDIKSYINVYFYGKTKNEYQSHVFVYTNDMFSTWFPLTEDFIEGDFKEYYESYLYAKEYGTHTAYTGTALEELFSYNWDKKR